MKTILTAVFLAAGTLFAQIPDQWDAPIVKQAVHNVTIYRGESYMFSPRFTLNDQPYAIPTNATVTLYWTTNNWATAPWATSGVVVVGSTGVVHATWTPACDSGSTYYQYFVGVGETGGLMYRARGQIVMGASPGFQPSGAPLPVWDGWTNNFTYCTWAAMLGVSNAVMSAVTSETARATAAEEILSTNYVGPLAATSTADRAYADAAVAAETNRAKLAESALLVTAEAGCATGGLALATATAANVTGGLNTAEISLCLTGAVSTGAAGAVGVTNRTVYVSIPAGGSGSGTSTQDVQGIAGAMDTTARVAWATSAGTAAMATNSDSATVAGTATNAQSVPWTGLTGTQPKLAAATNADTVTTLTGAQIAAAGGLTNVPTLSQAAAAGDFAGTETITPFRLGMHDAESGFPSYFATYDFNSEIRALQNDGVSLTDFRAHNLYSENLYGSGVNISGITAAQVGADPAGTAGVVQANLTTHTNRTDNPHSVTAAQVGALSSVLAATTNYGPVVATSTNGQVVTVMYNTNLLVGPIGATGGTGATGANGTNAMVVAGTVTTLPAGTPAWVTNTVSANTNMLTFGIPAGTNGTGGAGSSGDSVNVTNLLVTIQTNVSYTSTGTAFTLGSTSRRADFFWTVTNNSTVTISPAMTSGQSFEITVSNALAGAVITWPAGVLVQSASTTLSDTNAAVGIYYYNVNAFASTLVGTPTTNMLKSVNMTTITGPAGSNGTNWDSTSSAFTTAVFAAVSPLCATQVAVVAALSGFTNTINAIGSTQATVSATITSWTTNMPLQNWATSAVLSVVNGTGTITSTSSRFLTLNTTTGTTITVSTGTFSTGSVFHEALFVYGTNAITWDATVFDTTLATATWSTTKTNSVQLFGTIGLGQKIGVTWQSW